MDNQQEQQAEVQVDPAKGQLELLETAQDYFGKAHDYIAQSTFPGHMGAKVTEVMRFLKFQYESIKQRVDSLKAQIEAEAKSKASTVDVDAAKAKVAEALGQPALNTVGPLASPASLADEHGAAEAPKA